MRLGVLLKARISRSFGGNAAVFAFLAAMGVFMALPLVYIVVNSFKPINELFLYPPRFFVQRPTLDNFLELFQLSQNTWVPFNRYLFNSLFIAVGGTLFYIYIASMAGFVLAKYRIPGVALYLQVVIWAMLFRPEVMGIPQYIIITRLGLLNSYLSIILPAAASSMGVFMMRQFMTTIYDTLMDAARIDGAGDYRIYWRVAMPMMKPAWLTLTVFTFQALWNLTGVQYLYDESVKPLPYMLQQVISAGIARAGAGAAVGLVLMLPPILIFVFAQSAVIETMSHTGIKE
jgi:putative chitobiose transport system permease protein